MSTRKETERAKLIQEKCQTLLTQMLRDEDNKYCVDCDAKGPRWASWNLGVFLCIRCAGIHRKLGVHISRVKSVNLDSWTPEQVVSLQQMGNSRARAVYEAQLPDGFRRPQTDSALESFIRAKYEHKKYLAREWVPPSPPKVDWAKEIDEELERQKRKKKAAQGASSLGIVAPLGSEKKSNVTAKPTPIPAPLPKPKSSNSPKSSRVAEQLHASSDLLGLSSPTNPGGDLSGNNLCDSGSDGFGGFLSASTAVQNPINGSIEKNNENSESALAKEEADFFNQASVNTASDKAKMSKDSILALYGTAPTSSIGQFNNNPLVGFNNTFSHPQVGTAGAQFMPNTQPAFPAMVPGVPTSVPHHSPQTQFGHTGIAATNLNLNLAGMPPGLLGPPQPHPHTQFMTPPNSVTMYNQPVMTAPGAFTSAMGMPQVIPPQQSAFSQYPAQPFGTLSSAFGAPGSATVVSGPTQQTAAAAASTNLSQQFGNLNLGNVWQ